MGLRDDDARIYKEDDVRRWAAKKPRRPGDYDHKPSEEDQAAYDYDIRKWAEQYPDTDSGYDDRAP